MPTDISLTAPIHDRPEYLGGPHAGGEYPDPRVQVDEQGVVSFRED